METNIRTKGELIDSLIKQLTESVLLSQIMKSFEGSKVWEKKEERAKAKVKIDQMNMKEADNQKLLDFLTRNKEKLIKEYEDPK